ncbi:MAG: DUF5716 family protein [Clostridiales bacterium]|nr:DUF5716 family protein [Clostridiales bacterium]
MNEIRDLIVGIDFGEKTTQLCYYDRRAEEPRSLPIRVGTSQYEAPTVLCRRLPKGDYFVGLEAEYFAREKGGVLIENLYQACQSREKILVAGEEKEPWELLGHFLKGMLKLMGILEIVKNTKCLAITLESLHRVQVENLTRACEWMGFPRSKFMFLDYGESFYYYALGGKRETWNRSVAWYAFSQEQVTFRRLTINGNTRPILVRFEEPQETRLPAEEELRDVEFCQFIHRTLGKELFSSIQITGTGFDPQWAKQAIPILCYQKRKVFYGNNLFARGACMAGKDRMEDKKLKGYRYMSDSLVLTDVGMDMRVMGSPTYYPLIEAGSNWYECSASCELILDDTSELVFVVNTPEDSKKKRVSMPLVGLPVRPNRTTRLSLELACTSATQCQITVRDLGFGEMYPSSGKVWRDSIQWPGGSAPGSAAVGKDS